MKGNIQGDLEERVEYPDEHIEEVFCESPKYHCDSFSNFFYYCFRDLFR